jgi:hypothetical protein
MVPISMAREALPENSLQRDGKAFIKRVSKFCGGQESDAA